MSGIMKALSQKISGVARKVNSGVSDAMSYPARAYYGAKAKKANYQGDVLQRERREKLLPDQDRKGNYTDAYKNRIVADGIRRRHGK
jgi:4-hydroxyphenylpyruvate dioxygenase-like putative hemolysin